MSLSFIQKKFSQWTYHSYHSFFKVVMDNWKFTTTLWKVPDIQTTILKTWIVLSGFQLSKEKHWRSYFMISTWSRLYLAGKSLLNLIKIRKGKGDQTLEGILYHFVQYFQISGKSLLKLIKIRKSTADQSVEGVLYHFVQYFERHCLSSSGCYKLWLSETSSLQFQQKEFLTWYSTDVVKSNGFSFVRWNLKWYNTN